MELYELWEKTLGEIELQVSRPNFATWLKNSQIINKQEGVVVVGLPNNFAKGWVEEKWDKIILGTLRSLDESVKKVEFVISPQKPSKIIIPVSRESETNKAQLSFSEFKIDPETNLNPQYNLEAFAVGSSNEMAYAAIMAVVNSVGTKYNPLFIYGGVGVGKTHMIQAAGNEIKNRYQNKLKVRYVPSEKFTNDVIWAIRNKRMDMIKVKYRNVDVLIIDDIQFIGGKVRTEEEFFHTFNTLHEQNKQIIISSDRPPRFIPTLEERMKSRFEGGITVDVGYPDFELKVAVLKLKLEEAKNELDDDVINLIASKVSKSLRELEGILNKVLFYKDIKKTGINTKLVEQIINNVTKQPTKAINPNQIIKTVAGFFEVSSNDLTGRSRKQEIVEPRQIAIYLLRDVLSLSYPFIADKLGKRDHTTAIYAYEKINKGIQENQALNQKVLMIKDLLEKE